MMQNGEKILELGTSYRQAILLLSACKEGVFEALAQGPLSSEEMAHKTGLNLRALEIILPALVGLGLLKKSGDAFFLTPVAKTYLLEESEASIKNLLLHVQDALKSWVNLDHALKTGKPKEGEFLGGDEAAIERFIHAMDEAARPIAPKVADIIDWGGVSRVLDLGGGPGTYTLAFLNKCPNLRVSLFDLPRTLKIATGILKKKGKLGLFEILKGDCAEDDLGGPYDLVWVSHLMHARSEAWIVKVLKKIHASVSLGGRVIIHDYLLDQDKTGPLKACLFSVHMLAVTQEGRCYSFGEYSRMLQEVGFQKPNLTLGPAPGMGLIVAWKS